VVQLVSTINLNNDEDEMIWVFNSAGIYSSQSLYKVINFRGMKLCMFLLFGILRFLPESISFFGN